MSSTALSSPKSGESQRTLTRVWAETGSRPAAVKQTEYDGVYLFAAVNALTGASAALLAPTVNTYFMSEHPRFISREAGPDNHVVLVRDGAGWHVAKALAVPGNVTLMPLPPYSPELNPVERVWAFLRSHYLSNRAYRDYDHLFGECRDAWIRLDSARLMTLCAVAWLTPAN